MKKKILLVILIVVILLGIGGTYAYFATDVFKTNKELFFSYITKNDMLKNIGDEKLTEYINKQEEKSYTNKGQISIQANGSNGFGTLDESDIETLNNSKISFEGKTNNEKKLAEQILSLELSQGINIPIKIKRDGEAFGVQSNLLYNKFIAIRNEDLKAFFNRFNINTDEIPDKIELSKEQFTDAEIKTLKDRYTEILNKNLEMELFSKEKVKGETVISLKITDKKCFEILVKTLETARNDDILLNKVPEGVSKEDLQQQIDDMIKNINDTEINENATIEIKVHIKSRTVNKIEIVRMEDNNETMSIALESNKNELKMSILEENDQVGELNIIKDSNGNDLIYTITLTGKSEEKNIKVNAKMQYKNIKKLDNVEEICNISVSDEKDAKISLNYNNSKTFDENVEIEGLNSDNATILNDASDSEIQNLITTIYKNLQTIQ